MAYVTAGTVACTWKSLLPFNNQIAVELAPTASARTSLLPLLACRLS